MDYEEQSRKERPFEGLSLEEAKRLFVYMCHVAHPSLAPNEIERRWGKVLPDAEIPTVFEALEIAGKIKEEINGSDVQNTELAPKKDNGKSAQDDFGKSLTILVLVAASLIGIAFLCQNIGDRRQKAAQEMHLLKKKEVQQEVTSLTSAAQKLLINSNDSTVNPFGLTKKGNSANDLLNMGLELQRLRGKMLDYGWIRDSDEFVLIEELLLKCYKRASTHHSDSYGKEEGQRAAEAEASYRLSLLYLPHQYSVYVREEDTVASLSENESLSEAFLNNAVKHNHYNAIDLTISIDREKLQRFSNDHPVYREIKARLTENIKRLAQHPDATSHDIYLYAHWISETHPSESLEYLKKAAEMGNEKAKKKLLILRKEALAEGNTLEE